MTYNIFCQCDSVIFSSERVGLVILTQNIDSIEYFKKIEHPPSPFGPTMLNYAAYINSYNDGNVIIEVSSTSECITRFIWSNILPGSYRFDWWQYFNGLPGGMYIIKTIVDHISKSYKVPYIR